MMMGMIQKILNDSTMSNDEMEAMCVIPLLNAMIENLSGMQGVIQSVLTQFTQALATSKTLDYKKMLLQGISVCFWADMPTTIAALEQTGGNSTYLNSVFEMVQTNKFTNDFELKKILVALNNLIIHGGALPEFYKSNLISIFKCQIHLAAKSVEIKQKQLKREKEEECEVDLNDGGVIGNQTLADDEDDHDIISESDDDDSEDEDYEYDDESGCLYDSKFDEIDEISEFR